MLFGLEQGSPRRNGFAGASAVRIKDGGKANAVSPTNKVQQAVVSF